MDEHFQTTDFWELSKSSNQISVVKSSKNTPRKNLQSTTQLLIIDWDKTKP